MMTLIQHQRMDAAVYVWLSLVEMEFGKQALVKSVMMVILCSMMVVALLVLLKYVETGYFNQTWVKNVMMVIM